jgi:hypothetical protein
MEGEMEKTILIVQMDKRRVAAPKAQRILTEFGCIIKTRLGIHDGVLDKCSNQGLMILELVGKSSEKTGLEKKLKALPGVSTKSVKIPIGGK